MTDSGSSPSLETIPKNAPDGPSPNEMVARYIDARIKSDRLKAEAVAADAAARKAELHMQQCWRECKNVAKPGVYAFLAHGRIAVVVNPLHDYPELTEIVQ